MISALCDTIKITWYEIAVMQIRKIIATSVYHFLGGLV